jgi:hypothetical protein
MRFGMAEARGVAFFMAILVFILSMILLAAGAASGYASLDLLPTGDGLLYALGAAIAVSASFIVFALGALIRRIDALAEAMRREPESAIGAIAATSASAPLAKAIETAEANANEPVPAEQETVPPDDEAPINLNRAGHLPSLGETETALETPEPPSLVGRYSSGGANYLIFDDGSIEAEMSEGTFKFASMGDFKRYLVERGVGKAS